jgi:hypothetical protein
LSIFCSKVDLIFLISLECTREDRLSRSASAELLLFNRRVPIQEAIRLPRLPFAPLDSTIGRLFSLELSHQLPRDFIWRREHVKDSPDDQSGLTILKRGE